MRNIQLSRPLAQWDLQAIIAMFCSDVDRHRSFNKRFDQTRIRLLVNLEARVDKCDNVVQVRS